MSAPVNTGGPAFPPPIAMNERAEWVASSSLGVPSGMTLRDYFAAKAMHGLITEPPWGEVGTATLHLWTEDVRDVSSVDRFAIAAYRMADAMLKARSA